MVASRHSINDISDEAKEAATLTYLQTFHRSLIIQIIEPTRPFSLQGDLPQSSMHVADQGCHDVPDREEDRDCHQRHNDQLPPAVGHPPSPCIGLPS
jgi:hypothetical protein